MDSLKKRLFDAAHKAEDYGPSSLRDVDVVSLLREAAGQIDEPHVSPTGHPRRRFDSTLVGVLARLIVDNQLHSQLRLDTIGVLMGCGAFNAEPVESTRSSFIADLADAVDECSKNLQTWRTGAYSTEKFKFGDLKLGEHFICWPVPGDNHGHGGYLGQNRMFVKCGQDAPGMPNSGLARNGSGIESSFPHSMTVIRLVLS